MFSKYLFILSVLLAQTCTHTKGAISTGKKNTDAVVNIEGVWRITDFVMSSTAEEAHSETKDFITNKLLNIGEIEFGANHVFKAPNLNGNEPAYWKFTPGSHILTITKSDATTDIFNLTNSDVDSLKGKQCFVEGRIGRFKLIRVK